MTTSNASLSPGRLGPGALLAERYRLTRLLGEGGMGEVWQASHVVTGRAVAIKQLRLSPEGGSDDVARLRFAFEARAACALEHPNVVDVLDFLEVADRPPLIVMELLRGETLAERLEREQALSFDDALRLFVPVVSAVGTAHARGIIHRDLKPANIFLAREGDEVRVKLLDFGIAKQLAPITDELQLRTQTGSSLGTPCYMAPEQAMGERLLDQRADIWSLGVIFYEVLCGARPVEGENAARMMVSLLSTGIIPIEQLVPDLPTELAELIGRMLSRDPALRPEDLREVATTLSRFTLERAPAFGPPPAASDFSTIRAQSAPRRASVVSVPATSLSPATLPSSSAETRAPSWRRRASLAVGLLSVGALLGAGIWEARAPLEPSEGSRPTALPTNAAPRNTEAPSLAPSLNTAPLPAASSSPPASADSAQVARQKSPPKRPELRTSAAASTTPSTPKPASASALQVLLPSGAACERSRECASHLCLAMACQ